MSLQGMWKSYKSTITNNCTNPICDSTESVYWQNKLFAASIIYILPLSFIAIIPGVYMSYKAGLIGMIVIDFLAIGMLFFVGFVPGVSVFSRKILFNGVLYITSLMLLLYLGLMGPGLLYLLAVTIFIVLTLHKTYGYIAVGLNLLICIGIAFWIYTANSTFGIAEEQNLGAWIAVSSNLVILSAAAVLLIPILFENLQSALIQEKKLRADIENDQRWLRLLQSAIENSSESIAIIEAKPSDGTGRKILYVNDAFEQMTGYSGAEMIGKSFYMLNGPKTSKEERKKLQNALENWQAYETEFINYKKDGSEYWVHVSFAPVMNANDNDSHWVAVGRDVTNRRRRESELRESLQEKETLLMEIHHRVKNNLAVVSSMMQLQAMEEEDQNLQRKLYDSVVRIRTMVTIHELLYESRSFTRIDFSENLKKLISMIVETFRSNQNVEIDLQCDPIVLNVNQAIPFSLIVNEIITNAFKHAFPYGESGTISIYLKEENGIVDLRVTDDGKGLPESFKKENTNSLGLKLIDVLSRQMNTSFEFNNRISGGTEFRISIHKSEVKGIGNAYLSNN